MLGCQRMTICLARKCARQSSTIAASAFHESAFGGKMPITGLGPLEPARIQWRRLTLDARQQDVTRDRPLAAAGRDGLFPFEDREREVERG